MKRRASEDVGSESQAKVSKEGDQAAALARADTLVQSPDGQESGRSRQRKAPAWLAGYVTGSSAKDLAKAVSEEKSLQKSKEEALKKSKVKLGNKSPEKLKPAKKSTLSDGNLKSKLTSSQAPSTSSPSSSPVLSSTSSSKPVASKSLAAQYTTLKSKPSLPSSPASVLVNSSSPVLEVSDSTATTTDNISSSSPFSTLNTTDLSDSKADDSTKTEENNSGTNSNGVPSLSPPKKGETPTMLEVVICVSTSGAMREFLSELQAGAREMVWRLQSLIPDLRIGVFAHTQGGIHDDKRPGSVANMDHNYIRTGGHSGTKWLDLGASLSQICAFISSLEPETVVYPDYVQDNLEMALWKLQRCMSWSSCSYRTVIMLGRGRPNSSSFYLQREHWRGWIRAALELGPRQEVPVIDWRLEARMLAQMGIHVFTLQASTEKLASAEDEEEEEEEEDGTKFFRETAATTNGQHFCLTEASSLVDVIMGVCCSCYGPDLLQEHRDELRDLNDGVMPPRLKDIFVSLGLHSKRRSLKTIPSLVGDLQALQNKMKAADLSKERLFSTSEEEEGGMSSEGEELLIKPVGIKTEAKINGDSKAKVGKKPKVVLKQEVKGEEKMTAGRGRKKEVKAVKNGRVEKKSKVAEKKKKVEKALKMEKKGKEGTKEKQDGTEKEGKEEKQSEAKKERKAEKKPVGRPRLPKANPPKVNSSPVVDKTPAKTARNVGRPRGSATKAAAVIAKRAATLTKLNSNNRKRRDARAGSETSKAADEKSHVEVKTADTKPSEDPTPASKLAGKTPASKEEGEEKKANNAKSKISEFNGKQEGKPGRGRPKKNATPVTQMKQGSKDVKKEPSRGRPVSKKPSPPLNQKSVTTASVRKEAVTRGRADSYRKLVNGKQPAGNKKTATIKPSTKNVRLRAKGPVTSVTRASLKHKK